MKAATPPATINQKMALRPSDLPRNRAGTTPCNRLLASLGLMTAHYHRPVRAWSARRGRATRDTTEATLRPFQRFRACSSNDACDLSIDSDLVVGEAERRDQPRGDWRQGRWSPQASRWLDAAILRCAARDGLQ